ncbi:MAG: hypothetical protein M3394_03375 [Actinomycetota bacterium]|nr:hypothetical protein [Actinomycetota bacterium]
MNIAPTSQPASPARATATLPARVGTLGLAFFFAAFVLLAWGATSDAAHAEEPVEAESAPLVASPDEAHAGPAPAEAVPPPASDTAPSLIEGAAFAGPAEEAVPSPTPPSPVVDEPVEPAGSRLIVRSQAEAQPQSEVVEPQATPIAVVRTAALRFRIAVVVAPAVHQCNADTFPTGAGWEATCVITIENTVGNDGATSSTVTTTWCLAAAGVLPPEGCDSETVTSGQLVTTVNQCNGILAGGSNVTCSVEVINNVPFGTLATGVTVNQCIGSGQGGVSPGGPPTACDPPDSSTSGATVTQCNGSANGGGAPERVQCGVVGAVTALPVTVNQCNGSTAAGSTVTCDVTFTNVFAAAVSPVVPLVPGVPALPVVPREAVLPVPDLTPTPTGTTSSSPFDDDNDTARGLTSRSGSSSRATRSPGGATAIATSLAATGASSSTLLFALLLLALGTLLLAGSTRRVAEKHTVRQP